MAPVDRQNIWFLYEVARDAIAHVFQAGSQKGADWIERRVRAEIDPLPWRYWDRDGKGPFDGTLELWPHLWKRKVVTPARPVKIYSPYLGPGLEHRGQNLDLLPRRPLPATLHARDDLAQLVH